MGKLDFYLVTDTHYFERSLGCSGSFYDNKMKGEQMCLAENQIINRALFEEIGNDPDTQTLLIAGDLSKNGEYESHISYIEDLKKLKAKGKRIFLITALHDFNDKPTGYKDDKAIPVKGTKREELLDLYYEFGYSDALCIDKETFSYTAQLADGLRLLAINVDGRNGQKGCIDDELKDWISAQIDDADACGDKVIAMEHYPLIPQQPVFGLVGDAHLKDWEDRAAFLASKGVGLIFTGHMHAQSIKRFTDKDGNSIIDVQTSASVGYPAKYRKVSIDGDKVEIKSLDVPDSFLEDGTRIDKPYFIRQFSQMIPNKLARMLKDGSPEQTAIQKMLLKMARNLTVGKVTRLAAFGASKELKDMKVTDFAVKLVLPMFAGDPQFTPGTAVYHDLDKLFSRLSPVLSKVNAKLSKNGKNVDVRELVLSSLYNSDDLSDNDCTFSIASKK